MEPGFALADQSSRVNTCVSLRMAGAAKTTIGNIMTQTSSHDRSQCGTKVLPAMDG
jgi:hypothetical protein